MNEEMDAALRGAHLAVVALESEIENAQRRRAVAFALANEKGVSSGDIARALGITPMQALYVIRIGHRTLKERRARQETRRAA